MSASEFRSPSRDLCCFSVHLKNLFQFSATVFDVPWTLVAGLTVALVRAERARESLTYMRNWRATCKWYSLVPLVPLHTSLRCYGDITEWKHSLVWQTSEALYHPANPIGQKALGTTLRMRKCSIHACRVLFHSDFISFSKVKVNFLCPRKDPVFSAIFFLEPCLASFHGRDESSEM